LTDSGRLEATITPSALSLPDGVTFAPTGLVIHQALTREDYDLTGRHLRLIDEAHEALEVSSVTLFAGDKAEAMRSLTDYASAKAEAAHQEELI